MSMFYSVDEVMAMAVRIEQNGAAFYSRAAEVVHQPPTRAVLERLAEWERGHASLFSRIRARLAARSRDGADFDPHGEAELYLRHLADEHVFDPDSDPLSLLTGQETAEEVIGLALRFERDSILFFVGVKEAMPDPDEAAEIEALIQEEFGHVAYLYRERQRLQDAPR